jgi:hypothetical protein
VATQFSPPQGGKNQMVGFFFFFFTLDLGGHSIPCCPSDKKKKNKQKTKLGGHQDLVQGSKSLVPMATKLF